MPLAEYKSVENPHCSRCGSLESREIWPRTTCPSSRPSAYSIACRSGESERASWLQVRLSSPLRKFHHYQLRIQSQRFQLCQSRISRITSRQRRFQRWQKQLHSRHFRSRSTFRLHRLTSSHPQSKLHHGQQQQFRNNGHTNLFQKSQVRSGRKNQKSTKW